MLVIITGWGHHLLRMSWLTVSWGWFVSIILYVPNIANLQALSFNHNIYIYIYIYNYTNIYIIILYIHTLYVHIECIKCPSYEVGNCLAGFFPGLPFSNALQVGRSDAGFFKGLLDCFSAVGRLRWVGCGAFWSFVQTYQKLYKVVAPPVISWFINPSNYRYLP